MGLTDYQVQFLGMIDKKAMSWVVRAADFENYYVMKLVVLKPGPLPTIGLTRYAVVNGKADSRVDTVVPIDARPDMLYRVRMDVHGDDFSLTVQGQMVDAWSEPRLTRGGIGFFSARGEESRAALGASYASIRHAGPPVRVPGALQYSNTTLHRRAGAGNHECTQERNRYGACGPTERRFRRRWRARSSLHLEGKRKEALRELNTAIENGEETAEVFAAKGHIQFELEQYDDAVKTYEKLLTHRAAASHCELQPGHLL